MKTSKGFLEMGCIYRLIISWIEQAEEFLLIISSNLLIRFEKEL